MLHIYVISLKKDIKKRSVISKALADFDLTFSFIDAIYGKALLVDILDTYKAKSRGEIVDREFPATPGEIGCTLSHLMAYQDILDNNLDWACILEDDAILDDRFKTFINTFQDSELDPTSLYLLGGQTTLDQKLVIRSIKNTVMIGGQKFSKTINSAPFIHGGCCYIVSSSLAKSLIALSKNDFIVADDWNYLVKNNIIHKIFLADFVDHPTDLSTSNIENERKLGRLDKKRNDKDKKVPLSLRLKKAIKIRTMWRLRLMSLKAYRYIEKKEGLLK